MCSVLLGGRSSLMSGIPAGRVRSLRRPLPIPEGTPEVTATDVLLTQESSSSSPLPWSCVCL